VRIRTKYTTTAHHYYIHIPSCTYIAARSTYKLLVSLYNKLAFQNNKADGRAVELAPLDELAHEDALPSSSGARMEDELEGKRGNNRVCTVSAEEVATRPWLVETNYFGATAGGAASSTDAQGHAAALHQKRVRNIFVLMVLVVLGVAAFVFYRIWENKRNLIHSSGQK
jgi:hypothetical protein